MASIGYSALVAVQSVTTHGVNWESITVIVIPIVGCLVGIATFLDSRSSKREAHREKFTTDLQTQFKDEITTAVAHLSEVLLERLETKEAVNQIRVEIAGMKQQIEDVRHATAPTAPPSS